MSTDFLNYRSCNIWFIVVGSQYIICYIPKNIIVQLLVISQITTYATPLIE